MRAMVSHSIKPSATIEDDDLRIADQRSARTH